jgi:hypothetical protein
MRAGMKNYMRAGLLAGQHLAPQAIAPPNFHERRTGDRFIGSNQGPSVDAAEQTAGGTLDLVFWPAFTTYDIDFASMCAKYDAPERVTIERLG